MFFSRFMLFPTFLEKKKLGGGDLKKKLELLSHFMFSARFMLFFNEFLKV